MRTIRLKETPAGRREHTPAAEYRRTCDDSLGDGPFIQEGTPGGFLDTGNARPAATRNLVMIGGSFVESLFIPVQDRFASRAERELPADWRVLNAGYSGMTTLHLLSVLTAKLPPYLEGGKLLIFIGQSDVNAISEPGSYWHSSKTVTPLMPAPEVKPMPWEPLESLERMLDATCATATALGIDYALVAAPFRDGNFGTDDVLRAFYRRDRNRYDRTTALRHQLRDTTHAIAERHARPVFDAQNHVKPTDFYDIAHLNEAGQAKFVEALAPWLHTHLENR